MLDDEAIARYARQIVIPGIGAAGQEKLLASTVLVVGDARGVEQASLYLRAAGVRVVETVTDQSQFDVAIVADAATLDPAIRNLLMEGGTPVCWYLLEQGGFTSGVHPAAPLPRKLREPQAVPRNEHDAAACDAAALACAILTGLEAGTTTVRFPAVAD